jgi:hypothetical protein
MSEIFHVSSLRRAMPAILYSITAAAGRPIFFAHIFINRSTISSGVIRFPSMRFNVSILVIP